MSLKEKTSPPGVLQYLKGLFFGLPKTGKTTTTSSGENTLLIEFEPEGDATDSLKDRTDVDVIRPSSPAEMQEIVEALHTSDRDTWQFVTVDSVTYMFEAFAGESLTAAVLKDTDPRRAYQRGGVAVNQVLHDLLALPCHVLLTCQQKSFSPGDDGLPLNPDEAEYPMSLDVTPMVYRKVTPAVSFIGRTYKKREYETNAEGKKVQKTNFYVSFDDGNRSPAGSRLSLPPTVKDLDMNNLIKYLQGGK